jgi:hypothetical protein
VTPIREYSPQIRNYPTPKNQWDGAAPFLARSHSSPSHPCAAARAPPSSTKQRMKPLCSSSLCNQTKNRPASFQLTKHRTERLCSYFLESGIERLRSTWLLSQTLPKCHRCYLVADHFTLSSLLQSRTN